MHYDSKKVVHITVYDRNITDRNSPCQSKLVAVVHRSSKLKKEVVMKITAPNYTQTPNDLFDHWLPLLKESELKVLLVIMRKTFGWHKVRDKISVSQLSKLTGLVEETVVIAVKALQKKGLILKQVVGRIGKQETYYELVVCEDSNNCYPPGNSHPPGFNPPGKSEAQKKASITKEKTTTQDAAVSSDEEKFIYADLRKLDIPEKDKIEITRRYDGQTVRKAIKWARSPQTKITTTLVKAIKWACKERPEIPKSNEDSIKENKAYAEQFDGRKNRSCELHALTKYVEISFITSQCAPVCIGYEEKEFKAKLDDIMEKTNLCLR